MSNVNDARQKHVGAGTIDNEPLRTERPLNSMSDEEILIEVEQFHAEHLPDVDRDRLLRAVMVEKNRRTYEDISHGRAEYVEGMVKLSGEEKKALRQERTSAFEPGMLVVILTVSLAAFLQGQVQSSINTASLYAVYLDIPSGSGLSDAASHGVLVRPLQPVAGDWILGLINATPFLAAAIAGCWMALPLSDRYGRKGSMRVAAIMVLTTSLLMAIVPPIETSIPKWQIILILRVVNGLGMGIKAVNTPMLASETATGYWRGTSILAWQLWVACGIMIGFAFNMIFALANDPKFTLAFILGAPILPALVLLLALIVCPESPRYYMRRGSPNYSPAKAYEVIKRLRRVELIALRDVFVLYRSLNGSHEALTGEHNIPENVSEESRFISFSGFLKKVATTFSNTKTAERLDQQLRCRAGPATMRDLGNDIVTSLGYSVGFGHAALYSAGLGPVPFTLAAESFPLTHREVGCAFAISTNLLFAGVLSLLFPSILHGITIPGSLGLFAALSVLAFVLVFLLVEETKQRSLEDLDFVFDISKRLFIKHQVSEYLPWLFKQYFPWALLQYIPWCFSRYFPKMIKWWLVGRNVSSNRTNDLEAISRDGRPPMPRLTPLSERVLSDDTSSHISLEDLPSARQY
ncbi:hypothetical protein G7054_g6615 [Neopestalotiopsis clavispora]|nr:hypothetical protein G7054_g6615 [Neopestalotiopsis clavispora]